MMLIPISFVLLLLLEFCYCFEFHACSRYGVKNRRVPTLSRLYAVNNKKNQEVGYTFASILNILKPSNNDKSQIIMNKKEALNALIGQCQPNGISASQLLREKVDFAAKELENLNPTKNPAYSSKMDGFWRMLYTDFDPKGPSAGRLGPFIGKVYQDLNSSNKQIANLLSLEFPPIKGGLVAKQSVEDSQTWKIEFDRIGNFLGGLKINSKTFPAGKEIRLWKITYLDDDFRILRARRPESSESFIFILQRDEKSRFFVDI